MKLIFKNKPLVKAGYFKGFEIKAEEIKKIKFKKTVPLMRETPISKALVKIGQVASIEYHKATNTIRGNLEFEKRPEYTAYEPFLVTIHKGKKTIGLELKHVLSSDKSFMNFWIKWGRFGKNIRKFVSSKYR